MTINKNLVGLGDCELHRPFHGGIFTFQVILLKFDVNLPNIFSLPSFKIRQIIPQSQSMTDNSVFPSSSQLKGSVPEFKKGPVLLIESCPPTIISTVTSVKFSQIFKDLDHRGVLPRLLSNLSSKEILNGYLPPLQSR